MKNIKSKAKKIQNSELLIHNSEFKKGVDYIGVTCVFFCHDGNGKLLLHKRSNSCKDEKGMWDPGGGSLEVGEEFEEGVRREVKEEYCTDILKLDFVGANNVLRVNDGKRTHWIALVFVCHVDPNQVKIGEPEKMDDIGWFKIDDLPSPLHSQFDRFLEEVKKYIH